MMGRPFPDTVGAYAVLGPCSSQREAELPEHYEVGVKPDPLEATDAKERASVWS